ALTASAPGPCRYTVHRNGVRGEQHDHTEQKPAEQDHECGVSETRAFAREVEAQWPQDTRPHHTEEKQKSPEADPHLSDRPQGRDEDDENQELEDERPGIERG